MELLDAWARAVELGASGHYAAARGLLEDIERATTPSPALPEGLAARSLALSTAASLDRQLGHYRRAAIRDGAAARIAMTAQRDARLVAGADLAGEAWCDAMTGLAADMLGSFRMSTVDALLGRVRQRLDGAPAGALWRQRVRLSWVQAERALFSGAGASVVNVARDAARGSVEAGSERHRIKSELILAAALGADGQAGESLELAARCHRDASAAGLLPLAWASAMLLTSDPSPERSRWWQGRAAEWKRTIELRGGWFA
ncbi:hypothetical protein [Lolliginicoccus suaedae]|uniref:hypothetical protein n=1 Tax=Lolliginicoccus suaedae TaxID=2605429 RepID=UPI0011ED65CA|nr:hypothetical protein [Lolliginicoccus suaedae]